MSYEVENVDVVVIGAGHAGCEAALACARIGLSTIIFTVSLDSIAMMPCNPNVGGSAKGHLVRELDALGGEMGKNIDKTYLQSKMLNTSKGPAVHSLRAQADKYSYSKEMKMTLEKTKNLKIKQSEISKIIVEDKKIVGVETVTGLQYKCKAVIISSGTYLNSRCITGDYSVSSGPNGLQPARHLSDCLIDLGIELYRFKTGTPCRVDKNSLDFSKMEEQLGDEEIIPFSFTHTSDDIKRPQISCWLTYTNANTHQVIKDNLHLSPLYSGQIKGVGPRYCPSIEDKIVRFADKERHQLFLEPEGENTNEMYVQGMSSSLPEHVQLQMLQTIAGLENCEIMRSGYAIEYDCINPTQLKLTLEFKDIDGLFSAGQFNGTSGYEEAASQGLIAGINASMKVLGKEPLVLDRSEAYIGVLIDDLITKGTNEPYRMLTSRSEYRLLLRQDNADARLTEKGHRVGLIPQDRYEKLLEKQSMINAEVERLRNTVIGAKANVQEFLENYNSTKLASGVTMAELIKRPELDYELLKEIDKNRLELPRTVREQVNIILKYEGYIKTQIAQVEQFKKLEQKLLPEDIDYNNILSLRLEAKQKLNKIRPISIGQASRISGVSPADISVLLVSLEQIKRATN